MSDLRIGVALPAGAESGADIVAETVELARRARRAGLTGVWLSQRFDTDALSLAAVVGHAVRDISVGTRARSCGDESALRLARAGRSASRSA